MIYVILFLMVVIILLCNKIWNDRFYETKNDRIRIRVIGYYIENFSRYRDENFYDVILDYCREKHKPITRTVLVFDRKFIEQHVGIINHLL